MAGEARDGATIVREAFLGYRERFRELTSLAGMRFVGAEWAAARVDAAQRLDLYPSCLGVALAALRARLGDRTRERAFWQGANQAYGAAVSGLPDEELAHTFFNSVTRRLFARAGVDPSIEFVAEPLEPSREPVDGLFRVCQRRHDTAGAVARLLDHHRSERPFEDLGRDATRIARELDEFDPAPVDRLETVEALFHRDHRAYLVGRVHRVSGTTHPIVVPLVNERGRIVADTVLLTEDEASVVFSFTRSYFFVEAERPRALVAFLRTLLPRKPVSDLYDAIGYDRHGKTELYRALRSHLAASDDPLEQAPGQRGMVMLVLTLPSYDLVFKVIRDEFPPPKTATRRSVMAKYALVFRHDRAGRLIDAREFEHLEIEARRFPPALRDELLREAGRTVELGRDSIVMHHLYTERRLRPLDLYLRESSRDQARAAILDYGEAIRDLARSNIFPGDMLLKNFGVTRHGRVVFYDYDELALLTDCRFRELPRARYDEEEVADEPWFFVGENDVFPEEFLPFLGLQGDTRDAFMDAHRDLLSVGFWTAMQEEHRAGRVPEILPYPARKRFPREGRGAGR